jgi:glucose-6-phosphate dehydrogenase assembly protein OpcA
VKDKFMTVSAQAVEKDLAALWESESRDSSLHRVYTTNLVAYASDIGEAGFAEKILLELVGRHPGRYILIRPAADAMETPLKYGVSGHCLFQSEKGKMVCCDLVKLEARKDVIESLYGFTFSLLMTDLPVEFWWLGDWPGTHIFFDRMASQSSRVWVDSSHFSQAVSSLAQLAASWDSRFPNTILGDLNWVRIRRWRSRIAELFDGEWSVFLKELRSVVIEFAQGTQPIRGFLLACWLAGQLGWKYQGPRCPSFPMEMSFEGPRGGIQVDLKPTPVSNIHQYHILAVRLKTEGEKSGLFTVQRGDDPHCVSARYEINGRASLSRMVRIKRLETDELLDEGLKRLEADESWKKTLAMAGTILETPKDI